MDLSSCGAPGGPMLHTLIHSLANCQLSPVLDCENRAGQRCTFQ